MPEKLWVADQKQLKQITDQLMERRMGNDWRTFFDPPDPLYYVDARVDWESGRFLMSTRDLKKLAGSVRINEWNDTVTEEFYRDAWGTALMDAARQLIKLPIVDRLYNRDSNGSGIVDEAILEQYELKGPGLGEVPLEEMRRLYNELDGWLIGIHINRACVLWPPKAFGGWFEPVTKADVVCRPGTGCHFCILRGTKQCKQYQRGSERLDQKKGEILLPADALWEETGEDGYGVAFDIGTTTIAAMVWDLREGERSFVPVTSKSIPNPQRIHGVDVISRIEYAQGDPERIKEMQDLVVGAMKDLMGQLTSEPREIRRISAVGNPTMMHFLFGKDPAGLAKAPFVGEELPLEIDAETIGLRGKAVEGSWSIARGTKLRTLPVMGGHLGADAAAALLAARLPERTEPTLLVDVGTNGELLLTDGTGGLRGCSTAAGPAFEGGSITPGSKFIDAAASMLDQGWMDEDGCVSVPHLLNQNDIRQLQMAKAAVAAGIELLAGELRPKILLAGTFGSHLKPERAVRIGLLPEETEIESCGNLAGVGASLILLSELEWKRGIAWAKAVTHVELADEPQFASQYVSHMDFPQRR